jgi:hypothetical protein
MGNDFAPGYLLGPLSRHWRMRRVSDWKWCWMRTGSSAAVSLGFGGASRKLLNYLKLIWQESE